MKRGYHYTSWENWRRISEQGLEPYPISIPDYPDLRGIWLWPKPLRGEAHIGSILYQVAIRPSLHIVLLEVDYSKWDIWDDNGRILKLLHDGSMANWTFHWGVKGRILAQPIPPSQIQLVAEYNLLEIFSYEQERA